MLRSFESIKILKNHLKKENQSIAGCVINLNLNPKEWKLISLKKKSKYYYVKKDDLELEYSEIDNKEGAWPKFDYIDLF